MVKDALNRHKKKNAFTRGYCCSAVSTSFTLIGLQNGLCHSGVTRLLKEFPWIYWRCQKALCLQQVLCRLYRPKQERSSRLHSQWTDWAWTASRSPYIITYVDEYSRFLFALFCDIVRPDCWSQAFFSLNSSGPENKRYLINKKLVVIAILEPVLSLIYNI